MTTRKAHMHSFYYDPRDLRRCYQVRCSPATKTVVIKRLSKDVLTSKAGVSIGCTNSNCAVRLGKETFGHDVFLADFSKTSVYIVDKLDRNGQPKHCVWYKHNDGASIDLNDHVLNRQTLLEALDMSKDVVLRPPIQRFDQKNNAHKNKQAPRTVQTARRKPVAYGAMRRASEAGLIVLQK